MTVNNVNRTSSAETQVVFIKTKSKTFGILGLVFGLISVFILSVLFVPLSIVFSVLGLLKRDPTNIILGASGLVLSLIGLMTSPMLMGLVGLGFMR